MTDAHTSRQRLPALLEDHHAVVEGDAVRHVGEARIAGEGIGIEHVAGVQAIEEQLGVLDRKSVV